jgi:hypothetical protein
LIENSISDGVGFFPWTQSEARLIPVALPAAIDLHNWTVGVAG